MMVGRGALDTLDAIADAGEFSEDVSKGFSIPFGKERRHSMKLIHKVAVEGGPVGGGPGFKKRVVILMPHVFITERPVPGSSHLGS